MQRCEARTRRGTRCKRRGDPRCFQHAAVPRCPEASKEPVASAPAVRMMDDDEAAPVCPICFESEGKWVQLRCAHHFHEACIRQWESRSRRRGLKPTCPMCRSGFVVLYDPHEPIDWAVTRHRLKLVCGALLLAYHMWA